MLPAPIPYPDPNPLVVKLYGETMFVVKDNKLRVFVAAFGGDKIRVRARVISQQEDRTLIIDGTPVPSPMPPADFGFDFVKLPLRIPLRIVVDATDSCGRTARDIANFVAVGSLVEGFNIEIEMVENRVEDCSVYAYGTSNKAGVFSFVSKTEIENTATHTKVAGTAITPNPWWDWAVRFELGEAFPKGAATLFITGQVVTPTGTFTDPDNRPITIGECGEPDHDTTGEG